MRKTEGASYLRYLLDMSSSSGRREFLALDTRAHVRGRLAFTFAVSLIYH